MDTTVDLKAENERLKKTVSAMQNHINKISGKIATLLDDSDAQTKALLVDLNSIAQPTKPNGEDKPAIVLQPEPKTYPGQRIRRKNARSLPSTPVDQ